MSSTPRSPRPFTSTSSKTAGTQSTQNMEARSSSPDTVTGWPSFSEDQKASQSLKRPLQEVDEESHRLKRYCADLSAELRHVRQSLYNTELERDTAEQLRRSAEADKVGASRAFEAHLRYNEERTYKAASRAQKAEVELQAITAVKDAEIASLKAQLAHRSASLDLRDAETVGVVSRSTHRKVALKLKTEIASVKAHYAHQEVFLNAHVAILEAQLADKEEAVRIEQARSAVNLQLKDEELAAYQAK
ncbi:hypothetical protein ISF_02684 [Cordyceps fumosorosea ARSEF 2679]|uniref:Uncharacterized protein n=1 Tax=Cordyceps fumosorosea (strain ARSEF 2679) TaxID=1081104 RepID=A0A168BYH4_CORFA|nr:hypothetical protein ISF_02684 [Cordyceps fumosorosea ARSEF 2679]OAA70710.1 hypothetical protein ISF_02684 [Cordyceps fumosorosea ARSEF 2679]